MALNYQLFRVVVAPAYAGMTDAELDVFAAEAEIEISKKKWLTRYDRGVAYITAHLITMSKKSAKSGGDSETGPLKKKKVGNLEREFGVNNENKDGSYSLTTYGMEFLRLRKQVFMGPKFVSC